MTSAVSDGGGTRAKAEDMLERHLRALWEQLGLTWTAGNAADMRGVLDCLEEVARDAVRRPAGWPPAPGDIWQDANGDRWVCTGGAGAGRRHLVRLAHQAEIWHLAGDGAEEVWHLHGPLTYVTRVHPTAAEMPPL